MNSYSQLPYYIQLTIKLLLILIIGGIIYLGQDILVPIYFSILLSIVLLPVTNFLERRKIPKAPATLISVIMALLIIAVIIYLLSAQLSSFMSDFPAIKKHLSDHYVTLQKWINLKFNISFTQQSALIQNAAEGVKSSGGEYIGQTFTSIVHTFMLIVFVAIYSFLILYYRHIIKHFLFTVFHKDHNTKVQEVLIESKSLVKNYVLGLLIEMGIVAIANTVIFLCIGIKYAGFLGVFAAILNIIPYVGIFTATLFTVLVTLTTSSQISDIIWVIISLLVVHFIDSNFLMPRIVGSKVKINALMTITGVVIGGSLIGLSGIFLALPTIGILKIIFDKIDGLKPWGILMGDESSGSQKTGLYKKLKNIGSKTKPKKITTAPV